MSAGRKERQRQRIPGFRGSGDLQPEILLEPLEGRGIFAGGGFFRMGMEDMIKQSLF